VAPVAVPVPVPTPGTPATPPAPPPEEVRSVARIGMFRRYPVRCLCYIVAILGLITATAWAFGQDQTTWGLVALVAAGLVAARFLYWFLTVQYTSLVVTNRRVMVETGLFTREASEVPLKSITGIQIEQDVVQALFGVGDLIINCEKGSKQQMLVLGVIGPEPVVQQINAARG